MTSLSAQDVIALNHGNHANIGSGPLFEVPRKFTWKELSRLNEPHNAHIAYRGKVSGCTCTHTVMESSLAQLGYPSCINFY